MPRATIARSPDELVEVKKRRERRWATIGKMGFGFGGAVLLAVPSLLGLLVATKHFGSNPRYVTEEHLLRGEFPVGFPRTMVRDETSALSKSFDYVSFQVCTLSDPRQAQEIRKWLNSSQAQELWADERRGWLRSSPPWFQEVASSSAIEWRLIETKTGRLSPDKLIVGLEEKKAKLLIIVSKP